MSKKNLLKLGLLFLFIFSVVFMSCENSLNSASIINNEIQFKIGDVVSESINRTLSRNAAITDQTPIRVDFSLLRGDDAVILKRRVTVAKKDLKDANFVLTKIPMGNNYKISMELYYNDILIYDAVSDKVSLNDATSEVNVNLTLNQHNSKISYDLNGGNFIEGQRKPEIYFINSTISKFPLPIKEGFKFDGWYLEDGSRVTSLGKELFLGNITLKAKWIELDKMPGVHINPEVAKLDYTDTVTLTCDEANATIYYTTDGSIPTENSTVYEKPISLEKLWKNDKVTIKAIASKKDMKTSDVVSRTYEMNKYTVTFKTDKGNVPNAVTSNKGGVIVLPSSSDLGEVLDYTFDGWLLNGSLLNGNYTVNNDVILTAKWTQKGAIQSVTFKTSDKSTDGSLDYEDTVTLECLTPGAKIYYKINDGVETEYTAPITIRDDITKITAVARKAGQSDSEITSATYNLRKYNITFNNNNHGTETVNDKTVKMGDVISVSSLQKLTEVGYEFEGWSLNGQLIKSDITVTKELVSKNKTIEIVASWKEIVKDVTFNPSEADIDYSVPITLSTMTSGAKIYYTLDGSNPVEDPNNLYSNNIILDNNWNQTDEVTVKAIAVKDGLKTSKVITKTYKMKRYTVTFKTDKGNIPNAVTSKHKGEVITLPSSSNLGEVVDYTFDGWLLNGSLLNGNYTVNNDVTLTASWTKKDAIQRVTFKTSSVSTDGYLDYKDTVTLECSTPGATIYYKINDGVETEYTTPITIQNDITKITAVARITGQSDSEISTATYNLRKYNITFNNGGHGNAPSVSLTLKKGDEIPPEHIKALSGVTGYTFNGWKDSKNEKVDSSYKVYETTVITANWTPITYKVVFNGNNSTSGSMSEQVFTYDVEVPLTAIGFARTGYDFIGWNNQSDGKGTKNYADKANILNLSSVQDTVINLYAQWTPITYTITYENCESGSYGISVDNTNNTYTEYNIESDTINLNAPTSDGFSFEGWYSDSNFATFVKSIPQGSTEDKTLYAKWKDTNTPDPISSLTMETAPNQIKLSWTNPKQEDIDTVSIAYSDGTNTYTKDDISVKGEHSQTKTITLGTSDHISNGNIYDFTITVKDSSHGGVLSSTEVKKTQRLYALTETPKKLTGYTSSPDISDAKTWTYVEFGDYPQTWLSDTSIIISGKPTVKINNNWDCYYGKDGYYYIKKKATYYKRPEETFYFSGTTTPIDKTTDYYFRLEPIYWRIITSKTDTNYTDADGVSRVLLVAEDVHEGMPFGTSREERKTTNGTIIYPNNYEYSIIRAYLNGYNGEGYGLTPKSDVDNFTGKGFIDKAFTDNAKKLISTTAVDNKIDAEKYMCNNTDDKLFLLSYKEVTSLKQVVTYKRVATDYGAATNCDVSAGTQACWFYRTAVNSNSNPVKNNLVEVEVIGGRSSWSSSSNSGFVPALCLPVDSIK